MTEVFQINKSSRPKVRIGLVESSVALSKGRAACFNDDRTVASTEKAVVRNNVVEVPAIGNAGAFAGVWARGYSAETGGRLVEFHEPGSVCQIAVDGAYDAGAEVSFLVDDATAANNGLFGKFNGVRARGSARLLESTSEAGLAWAYLYDGDEGYGTHRTQPTGGAFSTTPAGMTYIPGNAALSSDATYTLENATYAGVQKSFLLSAAPSSNDVVITLTSAFGGLSGASLLGGFDTAELDGAGDFISVKSVGAPGATKWSAEIVDGPTLA